MDDTARLIEQHEQAVRECARCQGREHGDCDPFCQYWGFTASPAQRERAARQGTGKARQTHRAWTGPRVSKKRHDAA